MARLMLDFQFMTDILESIETNLNARLHSSSADINVGGTERLASVIGGSAVALYGLTRGSVGGVAAALLGGLLVYRGTTGHCPAFSALGISSADEETSENTSISYGRGIGVEKSIIIRREPSEIYRFWRNLDNLPRFMAHLESVVETDEKRSHWVATGPAGKTVEWDAEIINEIPDELIGWRSLEGSEVDNAGSVQFRTAAGNRGTEVRVSLRYDPPGGALGAVVAKLFGEEPGQQVEGDLRRLKSLLETGEVPTTEGQPTGRAEA